MIFLCLDFSGILNKNNNVKLTDVNNFFLSRKKIKIFYIRFICKIFTKQKKRSGKLSSEWAN